jgi:excisionase family DNA binding protein
MPSTNLTAKSAEAFAQRLLTLPEAAYYLGCTLWAVRELIWKGHLPYTQFGKRFQVDVRDLDELVERQKRCEDGGPATVPSRRRPRNLALASPSNVAEGARIHDEEASGGTKQKGLRSKVGV